MRMAPAIIGQHNYYAFKRAEFGVTSLKLIAHGGSASHSHVLPAPPAPGRAAPHAAEQGAAHESFHFAPEKEVVQIVYTINDPKKHLTRATLELFHTDDLPHGPAETLLWRKALTPAEFTHGTHHLPWNGHVPPGGDFPDGYVTVARSAYRLVVTVQGHGAPEPGKAWTFFHVKIADIELALGPRELLTGPTAAHDHLVYDQFHGALPAPGTTHLIRLRSNLFKSTDSIEDDVHQMYDNTAFAAYENLWGAGPRIPIFATVWIESSGGQKVLAPRALGGVKFLWDWEDVPEEIGHVHPQARAFLAETVDYYKDVRKPGEEIGVKPHPADNCHVDYGGKRGRGLPVFPPHPGVPPGPSPAPGTFPFLTTHWDKRQWAAYTTAWTKGKYASKTGAMFQPSRMAGDAWRVTVYAVHEKSGHLDVNVPDSAPLKATAKKSTGVFLTYREVQIALYLTKTPKVKRADLDTVRAYYEEARIKITGPARVEAMTKTEYDKNIRDAIDNISTTTPFLGKYAINPTISQYIGNGTAARPSPCAVTFRTHDELRDFIQQKYLAALNASGSHGPPAHTKALQQTRRLLQINGVLARHKYNETCKGYGGPICQDSKSASFKVDYVSLLSLIFVSRLGSA